MNVDLPGDESLAEFWLIIATMAAILIGILLYFRRKEYL